MRWWPVVLMIAGGCGGETELTKILDAPVAPREIPRIEVDPTEVEFLGVPIGEVATADVTVSNVGNATLTLSSWALAGDDAFSMGAAPMDQEIEPGQSLVFTVEYRPFGEFDAGALDFQSDDPVDGYVSVLLLGGGLAPGLDITPDPVNLPPVLPTESSLSLVTVFNPGGQMVTVQNLEVSGDAFSLPTPPAFPFDLMPGAIEVVEVHFTADELGEYIGQITATGNSPSGIATADLHGIAADKPVAICGVIPPEVAAAHGTTTWIGHDSVDPGGHAIVAHRWNLVQAPIGSAVPMPGTTEPDRDFMPDLAGTYTADLVVENDIGVLSEPCRISMEAVIEQDLWIEMYWGTMGDDMDLHLTQNNGAKDSGDDCYFSNCTYGGLPWGGPTTVDDPALDLDDISGTGPENINIFDPAPGTYQVYVHDYPGSVFEGANDVTVRIYVLGVLQWSDTRSISDEDDFVPFADIEWPSGTITPL